MITSKNESNISNIELDPISNIIVLITIKNFSNISLVEILFYITYIYCKFDFCVNKLLLCYYEVYFCY